MGVIFAIYRPGSHKPSGFSNDETLHSWTCKWESVRGESSAVSAPAHFARDCAATEAGFALLCALIGLEVILGAVAGAGIWLERGVSRQREDERLQLEKIETTAKHPGR